MKLFIQLVLYIFLLLVIFILITSKRQVFNIRSFTVLSDSMKPSLSAGSFIFVQKRNEYKKGDIVTYQIQSVDITHRIVAVIKRSKSIFYQTKGDGNKTADMSYVSHQDILGTMVFHIPYIGKAIVFLKTLPGLIIFILLPGMLFISMELQAISKELEVKEIYEK